MTEEDRQVELLLSQAARRREVNDWAGAIDLARRALSLDPDHARGHAGLAFSLLGARRLAGASIEAGISLALDGNDSFCHHAAAAVRMAERRLEDAWQHCLVAMQGETPGVHALVLGASIRKLQGQAAAARELLEQAHALEPDHPLVLVALARLALEANQLAEATRYIDAALAAEPADLGAHVVAGSIALVQGKLDVAEEHARFALGKDASDHAALHLFTAIKARRSPLLGLWWRFNAFVSLRSERGQIGLMLGSFLVVQLAVIAAGALGFDTLGLVLSRAWLGFCAYTWVAPALFRKLLARELEQVALRRDF